MPRPKTKQELVEAATTEYNKLWQLIHALPDNMANTPLDFSGDTKKKEAHWARDKNLRDILVHLYEWHQLLLEWVQANQSGQTKPFLPAPYTWKSYGQMNVEFWQKHQETSFEQAERMLNESHAQVMALIESFSNEELFTKKHFAWTGTTSLGSYCVSATSSHYDWAIKKIKAHSKLCQQRAE